MKYFFEDFGLPIFISLITIVVILVGIAFLDMTTCNARTEDIGFDHRWSLLGGCQIEVETGQWIPLDNYYFKQE